MVYIYIYIVLLEPPLAGEVDLLAGLHVGLVEVQFPRQEHATTC